ncbi:MAG TPA: alpha/beta hydrolase [Planctomycetaceae bacterium]|nr:alpha/beta hydrolase [Blastopirellula sp.]HAY81092.1 alpha/beta hydrolase [Planctomycetaceae bacterium]
MPPPLRSILDHPAVSGRYLVPQSRKVNSPFYVDVPGARLACHHQVVDPANLTLVHFHGNGEAVADYVPSFTDACAHMQLNTLLVEYRGYGASSGDAQLVAMLDDGLAAVQTANLEWSRVLVFGRSIGSLYAVDLAARRPDIAGLILESGLADPVERFLKYAKLEPVGLAAHDVVPDIQHFFNTQRKLEQYAGPLLLLHAENDGLIEITHAEQNLAWSASTNKRLVRLPQGNHNTVMQLNWQAYQDAIAQFVQQITSA